MATGLYGTLAYRVNNRTVEIGVRIAVGAQRGQVVWMVLRDSLMLTAVGVAIGVPLALLVGQGADLDSLRSEAVRSGDLRLRSARRSGRSDCRQPDSRAPGRRSRSADRAAVGVVCLSRRPTNTGRELKEICGQTICAYHCYEFQLSLLHCLANTKVNFDNNWIPT